MNPGAKLLLLLNGGPRWVTLPTMLRTSPDVLLEDFEDISDFSISFGSGADNAVDYTQGTKSSQITAPVSTQCRIQINSFSADMSQCSVFGMDFLRESAANRNARLYFFSAAGGDWYSGQLNKFGPIQSRWFPISLDRDVFVAESGASSWADINSFRFQLDSAGTEGIFSIDNLRAIYSLPFVLLQFDDADESVYTGAYQYTKTKGVLATFNLISGSVGGVGQVTLAQAQEMNAGGWDIANHSDDATSLVGLTQEQVATKLAACKTALDGWGMTRASMHHAYPGGAFDATVIAGAQDAGIVTGRGYCWISDSMFGLPAIDLMRWPYTTELGNSLSLAAAKALVDRVASKGGGLSIVGHKLVSGVPASSTEWNVDDYHALVDYIIQRRVYPITVSQMYSLMSGATRVLRPW